jgi:hypothetical protein
MLFMCFFGNGLGPMLVDAISEATVPAMCSRVAEKVPTKIVPIACEVFAANLFVSDDEGEEVLVDPLEEIADLLEAIDEEVEPGEDEDEDDSAAVCGDESEYEGETVICALPSHEDGEHEGTTSGGESVTWV